MTVKELLHVCDSHEITEWMAYDMTQHPDWVDERTKQAELDISKQMSDDEKLAAVKSMIGGT